MRKQTDYIELYTDYLISGNGYATATGLSSMIDGEVSHDQITRFLSNNEFTSKELWNRVKKTVRTQSNHIFLSVLAFFKLECLKIKHKVNHFAMRAKLLVKANQIAYLELQKLKNA